MSIGLKANRETIINQVRIKLMELDHNGIPAEAGPDEDPRETLLMMAGLAIFAIEEMDAKEIL